MAKRFANVQMSMVWEPLSPKREHAQLVHVFCVLALLRTFCPSEAVVEWAISLRGTFTTSMQGLVETHVFSICLALHSTLAR